MGVTPLVGFLHGGDSKEFSFEDGMIMECRVGSRSN